MQLVFAILGVAILHSVAADYVQSSAVLWLGAAAGWLGIIWFALAKA